MADKSVGELIAAQSVTPTDLFVLEQNGTAKKLTGQVLENWLVSFADGHGGIQSIAKLPTSGLVDTYRITLADTTTFDFVVNNGRGITGISKTGTSGLVDTYTISYNDGTSGTLTVTNGEKGDKGDNAYIWIKYASQEPTESSHSIGDIPDDWIGIYSGNASTAPTDWKQYKWYKIKGEKGDTGAPATIASQSVTYQVSDSGTIIPSGAWGSSIPVVSQGKYLWTKTELQFNTGDPIISYSVARMGMDGTGSVSSVAGVSPDETGNVALTAADVGAMAVSGGDMTGAINMNGHSVSGLNDPTEDTQSARKGYVDAAVRKAAPYNYAHNSDFTQFVAQAGVGGLHGTQAYAGDRWILDSGTVTGTANADGNGYKNISLNGTIRQKVENPPATGKAKVETVSGTATVSYANGELTITSSGGIIKNVLLCAAETLPEYRPKGYGAELAECQRYYYRTAFSTNNSFIGDTGAESKNPRFHIQTPVPIRIKNPTVKILAATSYIITSSAVANIGEPAVASAVTNGNSVYVTLVALDSAVGSTAFAICAVQTACDISADL